MGRNRNLAGLAALGALGYMLRDKGGAPVEDRVATPVITGDDQYNPDVRRADSEAIYDETGATSPLRRNLETGDLYNPNGVSASTGSRGMASTAAPAVAPVRRATATPNMSAYVPRRNPTAQDTEYAIAQAQARTPQAIAARQRQAESQAVENMTGDFLPMGKPLKALGAAAKTAKGALATRAADDTPVTFLGASGRRAMGDAGRLESSTTRQLGSEPGKLTSEPGKLTGPTKRQIVERDRAARAAKREAEKEEFNRRGVDRFIDSTFEGGMKKGGKVKAKPVKKMAFGGVTRSAASKRADGIATKGKTKCKIY
jgi:hypothetical protein